MGVLRTETEVRNREGKKVKEIKKDKKNEKDRKDKLWKKTQ